MDEVDAGKENEEDDDDAPLKESKSKPKPKPKPKPKVKSWFQNIFLNQLLWFRGSSRDLAPNINRISAN